MLTAFIKRISLGLLAFLLTGFFVRAQSFRVSVAPGLGQQGGAATNAGEAVANGVLQGRLLLLLADNNKREPRFQINDAAGTQLVFGVDEDRWGAGESKVVGVNAFGYPLERLQDVPAGDYWVQVVLNKYEDFHLQTGVTVQLPPDMGEGQHWNEKPGNIYSTPVKIHFDPATTGEISIVIDKVIPAIAAPQDSKYIKHIRIQSKLLTAFWGRPMYIGAHVLLPEGFDEHPNVKYPLAIFHGHFPADFDDWRTTPPDENLPYDTSVRFRIANYAKIEQRENYNFYKEWTGPGFPRVIAIEIEHANPYYDDSYAVNSANLGPYGDAITYELIPEIERRFRGIGQGWARFTYGGSTGGW